MCSNRNTAAVLYTNARTQNTHTRAHTHAHKTHISARTHTHTIHTHARAHKTHKRTHTQKTHKRAHTSTQNTHKRAHTQNTYVHLFLENCSLFTCFGWYLHPSSGAHKLYLQYLVLVNRYCYLASIVGELELVQLQLSHNRGR